MKALIFAAGLGTRLRPITETLPKALVQVGGKTLLERVILKLKESGFTECVINVHHFAQQIKDFVKAHDSFGVEISFSDETDLLRETGGGIRHAASLLNDGDPFLVHNVDIISDVDLVKLYDFHNAETARFRDDFHSPLATLLVSERNTERYLLFDKESRLVGWMNSATGEIKSPFRELAREAGTGGDNQEYCRNIIEEFQLKKYAFAGIHVISPLIFRLMADTPEKFSIISFYLSMCAKYSILAYPANGMKLVDVGKISTIAEAERLLA